MHFQLKKAKQVLRSYMRDFYSDEHLCQLLDIARSGELFFNSCCCFIGLPTRDHPGFAADQDRMSMHHVDARTERGLEAEELYGQLWSNDAGRRRLLIPMILAELKRRQRANMPQLEARLSPRINFKSSIQ